MHSIRVEIEKKARKGPKQILDRPWVEMSVQRLTTG